MQGFDNIPLVVSEEMQLWWKSKMAAGGHNCWRTRTNFGRAQLDHYGKISGKFKKNLTSGLGGDVITRLL